MMFKYCEILMNEVNSLQFTFIDRGKEGKEGVERTGR